MGWLAPWTYLRPRVVVGGVGDTSARATVVVVGFGEGQRPENRQATRGAVDAASAAAVAVVL